VRSGFGDLVVYRRSVALANEVRDLVLGWQPADLWSAGIQAIRAADSIGANIAEAMGRLTNRDQSRVLYIARGSANELEHWLAVAESRNLPIPPGATQRAKEIGRMLNGLIKALTRDATRANRT
jgi:four helix bundle protein